MQGRKEVEQLAENGADVSWDNVGKVHEDEVCSIMIYKGAFDHEYDPPKDRKLKEINNIMNNSIIGWEKISSHRFAEYGIQRGWRRVVDKDEFYKLLEHVEMPFEKKLFFHSCLQILYAS